MKIFRKLLIKTYYDNNFPNEQNLRKFILKRLLHKIEELYPEAKVFIQSVLPLPEQNEWTVGNVVGINALLKQCCYDHKCYYVNTFVDFLLPNGKCNRRLFVDSVHPTRRAVGLLARRFIGIIHPRTRFDPEVF